jgi:hypothetical protein
MIGIGLALPQVRGVGAAWTPAVFGADLTAWYNPNDPANRYQDNALTTPATADGNPLVLKDKTVSSNHLLSAADVNRATLKLNIANGRAVARFNGAAQYLFNASVPRQRPYTLAFAFGPCLTVGGYVSGAGLASWNISPINSGQLAISEPNTFNLAVDSTDRMHTLIIALADGAATAYWDGTPFAGDAGSVSVDGLWIGSRVNGNGPTQVDFGEILVVRRLITAPEAASLAAYLRGWGTP